MSSSSRPTTSSSRPTIWNACVSIALVSSIGLTLLLNFTAGGLQIKGNHGASLDRCTFKKTDTPYEYPNQPLAMDEPPYSTLFESVCIDGGTERPIRGLTSVTNGSEAIHLRLLWKPSLWQKRNSIRQQDGLRFGLRTVRMPSAMHVTWSMSNCTVRTVVRTLVMSLRGPERGQSDRCATALMVSACGIVDAVLAAAGGAYIEKMPVMLPELVVMITVVALVVSCSINVVSAYELGARFLCATRRARSWDRGEATHKCGGRPQQQPRRAIECCLPI